MSDNLHLPRKRDRFRNLLRSKSPANPPASKPETTPPASKPETTPPASKPETTPPSSQPETTPSASQPETTTPAKVQDQTAKQSTAPKVTITPHDIRQRILVNAIQKLPPDSQKIIEEQQLPGDDIETELGRVLETCEQKKKRCEAKKWTFEFRGKVIGLGEKVDSVLQWLNRFKAIGNVAASTDPIHAGLPWAVVCILLQTIIDERQRMACLVIGVEHVLYLTKRIEAYTDHLCVVQHIGASVALEKSLTELYAKVLEFLLDAIHKYDKSTLKRILASVWKLEEVINFDDECDVLTERIDSDADACFRKEYHDNYKSLKDDLKKLEEIKNISDVTGKIWQNLEMQKRTQILQWISDIPYQDNHKAADKGRIDGTAEWIFENPQFKEWETAADSTILWLHGIPGAGKTKLTANVVNHLLGSDAGAIAYFYCNRNEEPRRSPVNVLRTFVKQLSVSEANMVIRKPVLEIYEEKERLGFASKNLDYEETEKLLFELVERRETTLILDALDECEENYRRQLMNTFDSLVQKSSIKIFVSSRRDGDIKSQLERKANIGIEATDNQNDIIKYVKDTISENQKVRRKPLSDKLRNEIVETMCAKSSGMFQWAFLHINHLLSLKLESDIRRSLDEIPKGLLETYNQIYERIQLQEGSEGAIAIRAIQWIIGSVEPLEPRMLIAAVCQDPNEEVPQPIDDNIDVDFILAACQNLVTLVDMNDWKYEYGKVCQFSHLSVREYFEQERKNVACQGSKLVATVYLSVLLKWPADFLQSEAAKEKDSASEAGSGIKEFQEFIGGRWPRQIELSEWVKSPEGTEQVKKIVIKGGETSTAYQNWNKWFNRKYWSRSKSHKSHSERWLTIFRDFLKVSTDAAFLVCALGLDQLLLEMLEFDIDFANQKNPDGMSILQFASIQERYSTIELLVKFGAEINYPLRWISDDVTCNHTPLMIVAGQGDINIVEFLLAKQADVNMRSCFCEEYHGNVLTEAVRSGNIDLVRMLFAKGAEIPKKICVKFIGGALDVAINDMINDDTSMVQLLLDNGADVNMQLNWRYGSSLAGAVFGGNISAMQLLLDNGADVNMELDGDCGSLLALVAADMLRDTDTWIIQFLIDAGADVNMNLDGNYGCALEAAIIHKNISAVKLLIDAGADVNTSLNGIYEHGSALEAALWEANLTLVQLLLDRGADVNMKLNGRCGSALAVAAAGDKISATALLLDKGAEVNMKLNGGYGSALAAAAAESRQSTVQLLLDKGADIDMKLDGQYGSALAAAAAGGNESTVQLLLENGADVNMKLYGQYGSALAAAAANSCEEVIQLLQDNGADTSCSGPYGSLANSFAFNGLTSHLQSLYEQNIVDIQLTDSHERTPLHLAAAGNQFDTFTYLLSAGLDPTVADLNGTTPTDGAYAIFGKEALKAINSFSAAKSKEKSQITTTPPSDEGVSCLKHEKSWTPLHWALRSSSEDVIGELVEDGHDNKVVVTEQPEQKWSPLSIGLFHRKWEVLSFHCKFCKQTLGLVNETDSGNFLVGRSHKVRRDCLGCFNTIIGPFFQCHDHYEAKYCFMCFGYIKTVHKGHNWEYIDDGPEFKPEED